MSEARRPRHGARRARRRAAGFQARSRSTHRRATRGHLGDAAKSPGPHRGRRDRFRQEHAVAAILPRAGRGLAGLIAHTQPRRLAARALAARIADELSQSVGRSVGFKVRFADQSSDATRLLLMTDGLLLAELTADPTLSRYDTIIIDEAHERSLNVDLLLGVLKGLLPRRPDLKVIVTSATLDIERMAEFFGNAPVIRVSGRSFPVEVRYRSAMRTATTRTWRRGARSLRGNRDRDRAKSAGAMCWCSCPGSARSATSANFWSAN